MSLGYVSDEGISNKKMGPTKQQRPSCVATRPSTVDKPNREARQTGPTQAPPLFTLDASPAKAAKPLPAKRLTPVGQAR